MARRGIGAEEVARATVYEQVILLHASLLLSALLTAILLGERWAWWLAILATLTLLASGSLQVWTYNVVRAMAERLRKSRLLPAPRIVPFGRYAALVSVYCLIWVLNGLVLSSLYWAFLGAEIGLDVVATMVLATVAGVTIGFLAFFAPGGIGVREAVISAVLVTVMPADRAVMVSLLFRVWLVALDGVLGILLLWVRPGVRRQGRDDFVG